MSDLEFQRQLSPDQIDEAFSLLDNAGRAPNRNLQVEDSSPVHQEYLRADQEDRRPSPEDPQPRKKHLHLILAGCGLAIAVAGALTLLSWSDRVLTRPPPPAIAQPPNQPTAQPVKSASPSVPVTPDAGRSAGPALKPEVADPSPVGQTNRDNQAAIPDAASSPSATPTAQAAPAITTRQAWRDDHASRNPKEAWHRERAVRVAAAKKRFWRRHWQARAEIYSGPCFLFICLPPRVVYVR